MSKKTTDAVDAAVPADAGQALAGEGQVVVEAGPVEDPGTPDRPMASIRCLKPSPWGPVGYERNDVPADWAADAALDGTIELVV